MKNLLPYVLIVFCGTLFGQTLEKTYTSNHYDKINYAFFINDEINFYTIDRTTNEVRFYDSTHNLFKTVTIQLKNDWDFLSIYTITDKLFNSDSKIEFIVRSRNPSIPYTNLTVFNEDGVEIFEFELVDDFFEPLSFFSEAQQDITNPAFELRIKVAAVKERIQTAARKNSANIEPTLRDTMKLVHTRYQPMLADWISVLQQSPPSDGGLLLDRLRSIRVRMEGGRVRVEEYLDIDATSHLKANSYVLDVVGGTKTKNKKNKKNKNKKQNGGSSGSSGPSKKRRRVA